MTRVVFDVGGTWARAACVEKEALHNVQKVPTPQDPKEGFSVLSAAILAAAHGEPVSEVVGGFPGSLSPEGVVLSSPNLPNWVGLPLRSLLSEHVGVPVRLCNDADLAGLGEALVGAGKGYRVVMYVGLGTGVGGARIENGEITSHTKIGFEFGRQIVSYERGEALESLVGGASLEKKHRTRPRDLPEALWQGLLPALAAGLWNGMMLWSPDVVVLGGSLVRGVNGFEIARVEESVKKLAVPGMTMPAFAGASLGDNSGLEGARAMALS